MEGGAGRGEDLELQLNWREEGASERGFVPILPERKREETEVRIANCGISNTDGSVLESVLNN